MTLETLREQVLEANLDLVRNNLVAFTFGNASGFDPDLGVIVIKPSGVPYDRLRAADLVVTDLQGNVTEGSMRPSSDLPTHAALYQAFPGVRGIAHTHSRFATAWAQAGVEIPCLGTTHADYFYGPVPVTPPMEPDEIQHDYEWNTGRVIARRFAGLNPLHVPAVLISGHAPFTWGQSPAEAAFHSAVLEEVAHMAYLATTIRANVSAISQDLHDKHFLRKHGPKAYYGQPAAIKTGG